MTNEKYYPKRTDWKPVHSSGPNISHTIYRDVNRNGIYDIEDRALVKIAVKMTRPDNTTVVRRSNLNGFANFNHSLTHPDVVVKEPGEYKFEVIVPDGWEVTSGNRIQTITYRKAPLSRPGIVADRVPEPVGLAQILTISGKIKKRNNDNFSFKKFFEKISVMATSPTGEELTIPLDKKGYFSIDAYPGNWKVGVMSSNRVIDYERIIEVTQAPVQMSTIFLDELEVTELKDNVHVVDFEGITDSYIQKIPNGVAGVEWSALIVTDTWHYKGEGYINTTISGNYIGYNTSGHPVTISHKEGFDFYGAYFGVAWMNNAEGETLHIRAWDNDVVIGEESYTLSALGPFWFDADYRNITKLELYTEHYWQFVVDHIKIGV